MAVYLLVSNNFRISALDRRRLRQFRQFGNFGTVFGTAFGTGLFDRGLSGTGPGYRGHFGTGRDGTDLVRSYLSRLLRIRHRRSGFHTACG